MSVVVCVRGLRPRNSALADTRPLNLTQIHAFEYYIPARDVFFVNDVVERVQCHRTSVDNNDRRAWVHARIFGNVGKWAI